MSNYLLQFIIIFIITMFVYGWITSGSSNQYNYSLRSNSYTPAHSTSNHVNSRQECRDECYRRYQVCLHNNLTRLDKDCYGSYNRHCLPACDSY